MASTWPPPSSGRPVDVNAVDIDICISVYGMFIGIPSMGLVLVERSVGDGEARLTVWAAWAFPPCRISWAKPPELRALVTGRNAR